MVILIFYQSDLKRNQTILQRKAQASINSQQSYIKVDLNIIRTPLHSHHLENYYEAYPISWPVTKHIKLQCSQESASRAGPKIAVNVA